MDNNDNSKKMIDDLEPYDEDDVGFKDAIEGEGEKSSFFKSLLIGGLIFTLLVGSFWISFLIGKRVLGPVKKMPGINADVKNKKNIDKKKIVKKVEVKKEKIKAVVEKKVEPTPVPKKVVKTTPAPAKVIVKEPAPVKDNTKTVTTTKSSIYRIYAGNANSRSKADEIVNNLSKSGYHAFVREYPSGQYVVQAGAYKDKRWADRMVKNLREDGFSATIAQ